MYKDRKECLLVGKVNQSTISIKMGVARSYAASIIFNETTLWIVGGEQGGWTQHSSTEFITIDSKQQMTQAYGPELPFGIPRLLRARKGENHAPDFFDHIRGFLAGDATLPRPRLWSRGC